MSENSNGSVKEEMPNTEVVAKAKRKRFTAAEKLRILREVSIYAREFTRDLRPDFTTCLHPGFTSSFRPEFTTESDGDLLKSSHPDACGRVWGRVK